MSEYSFLSYLATYSVAQCRSYTFSSSTYTYHLVQLKLPFVSTYYCWVIYLPHEILPIRILDTLLCQERLCSLDLSQDPEQLHQPLVAPTSDISPFTSYVQDPLDLLLKTSEYRREEECFSRSLYFCVCFCVNFCILFVGVFLVQEFGHFDPLEVLIYLRYLVLRSILLYLPK